jgi:hypothetical protein
VPIDSGSLAKVSDMCANLYKSIKKFYSDQRGTVVEDYANILAVTALSFAVICVVLYSIQFAVINGLMQEIVHNLTRMAARM